MKNTKMKVAAMTALNKISMLERNIPKPRLGEALIKVDYVGICGSDLHYFTSGRIGKDVVQYPFVLGHEVSGTVIEVNSEDSQLKKGDRVAIEPQITCGVCEFCKSGCYNLCRDVIFFATPPVDGVLQEYITHPADLCFKLPYEVSSLEGALIEPLSVGLHAVLQGAGSVGQTAVVTGTGCIGLTSLLALRAYGVQDVLVTDLFERRLQKARSLGARGTINSSSEDAVQSILNLTEGRGFDLAIETSGSEIAASQLISAANRGATIVFVGYSNSGMMNLPMSEATDKELTFKTVFRYRNTYPLAISALANKQIDVKRIVSHTYAFEDTELAFKESVENKDEVIKAVIAFN